MSKGKNFEREISKKISLWLTTGSNPDCIWYTKSSGGRATRRLKSNCEYNKRYDFGDLGPDDACINYFFDIFSIELKTGYARKNKISKDTLWSILDLLDSQQQSPIFYSFWHQSLNDACESNRKPILIFRRNRREPCISMYSYIFNLFIEYNKKKINFDTISIKLSDSPFEITICSLENFFSHTWGIDENYIKFKIKKSIILNRSK